MTHYPDDIAEIVSAMRGRGLPNFTDDDGRACLALVKTEREEIMRHYSDLADKDFALRVEYQERAEAAEARLAEVERERERDALRERVGRLEAVLDRIAHSDDKIEMRAIAREALAGSPSSEVHPRSRYDGV